MQVGAVLTTRAQSGAQVGAGGRTQEGEAFYRGSSTLPTAQLGLGGEQEADIQGRTGPELATGP